MVVGWVAAALARSSARVDSVRLEPNLGVLEKRGFIEHIELRVILGSTRVHGRFEDELLLPGLGFGLSLHRDLARLDANDRARDKDGILHLVRVLDPALHALLHWRRHVPRSMEHTTVLRGVATIVRTEVR